MKTIWPTCKQDKMNEEKIEITIVKILGRSQKSTEVLDLGS